MKTLKRQNPVWGSVFLWTNLFCGYSFLAGKTVFSVFPAILLQKVKCQILDSRAYEYKTLELQTKMEECVLS